MMVYSVFSTSLGWMGLMGSEAGLRLLVLPRPSRASVLEALSQAGAAPDEACFEGMEDRLGRYLAGEHVAFDDVGLDLSGSTGFQRRVWEETRRIPYGETRSYRWLAEQAGSPRVYRTVGRAMAANPVPIVVPCHRVITSRGTLGGYGGGLELKRRLLGIEGAGSACLGSGNGSGVPACQDLPSPSMGDGEIWCSLSL